MGRELGEGGTTPPAWIRELESATLQGCLSAVGRLGPDKRRELFEALESGRLSGDIEKAALMLREHGLSCGFL